MFAFTGIPTQAVKHVRHTRKRPRRFRNVAFIYAGNDLLSHTLSRAVQSALRGLTSVFGMGTGGSPAVRSPTSRSRQLSASAVLTYMADARQTCKRPQPPPQFLS